MIDFIKSLGLGIGQFAAIYLIVVPLLATFTGYLIGKFYGKKEDSPARFAGMGCFVFFIITFIMAFAKLFHLVFTNNPYQ